MATLHVFHPLAQRLKGTRRRVPILMYHGISEMVETGHPYYHTRTSPAQFANHMRFLKDNGYTALRLDEIVDVLAGKRPEIQKPIAITFDDGYHDFYTHGFPILSNLRFTATMFLATAYVGCSLKNIKCMSWQEVREIDRAGIEFGSHTVNHPKLFALHPDEVQQEVRVSKEMIENALGKPVASFAYPYAFPETATDFVTTLREILEQCRYQVGVTTIIGTASAADDHFFLRRLPINAADDGIFFQAKLEGGYDWLHGIQRLSKYFKHLSR